MKDDDLNRLLAEAEDSAPMAVSDAFIAGIHRGFRRRRRRRRSLRIAGGMIVLGLAMTVGWRFTASEPSAFVADSSPAVIEPVAAVTAPTMPSEPLIRLQVQLEQTAALMLNRARRYDASADTRDQAQREYRRLIDLFPDTTAAAEARQRLPRGGQRPSQPELITGA